MVRAAGVLFGANKLGVPVCSQDGGSGENELKLDDGKLGGPDRAVA